MPRFSLVTLLVPRYPARVFGFGALLLLGVGLLQRTRFAPFGPEYTSGINGFATGFALVALLLLVVSQRSTRKPSRTA